MSENYYGASDGSILSDVDIQNEMREYEKISVNKILL